MFRSLAAFSLARSSSRALSLALPLCAGVILLSACAKRDETFLTVQMCVHDEEGVTQLKKLMRDAAQAENLQFVDGSRETGKNLKVMGADKALESDPSFAINVGIKGDGGSYVMGGNLGLPSYQVALGFGTGSDPEKAHRLSERLVRLLSAEWDVETVPQGKGVFPMGGCGSDL
jgi:hypothetical protein